MNDINEIVELNPTDNKINEIVQLNNKINEKKIKLNDINKIVELNNELKKKIFQLNELKAEDEIKIQKDKENNLIEIKKTTTLITLKLNIVNKLPVPIHFYNDYLSQKNIKVKDFVVKAIIEYDDSSYMKKVNFNFLNKEKIIIEGTNKKFNEEKIINYVGNDKFFENVVKIFNEINTLMVDYNNNIENIYKEIEKIKNEIKQTIENEINRLMVDYNNNIENIEKKKMKIKNVIKKINNEINNEIENINNEINNLNETIKSKNVKMKKLVLFKKNIFMRIHYLHMILVTRSYEGIFINNSLASFRKSITEQLKLANKSDVPLIPDFDEKCIQQYCDPLMGKCFNEHDPNELTMSERNKKELTDKTTEDPFSVSLNNYENMTFCICLMINNSYWENSKYFNNPVSIPYINLEKGYRELERLKRFIYNRVIPANWKSNEDQEFTNSGNIEDNIDKFYFYARNLVLSDKNLDKESFSNNDDIRINDDVQHLESIRKKGINKDIIDEIYEYANKCYYKTNGVSKLFKKKVTTNYNNIKKSIEKDGTYRDVELLFTFLETIKTMNSTSVVGTLDFTDEVSKYNLQYNKCSIPNQQDTNLVNWSNTKNILFRTPLLTTRSNDIPTAPEYFKEHILKDEKTVIFKQYDQKSKKSNEISQFDATRINKVGGAKTKKYKLRTKGKKKCRKTKKNFFLVSK